MRSLHSPWVWQAPPEWETALDAWELFLRAGGRSESTIVTRLRHIRTFARACGLAPEEVTEEQLLRWVGAQRWAPETRHSMYVSLRGFFGCVSRMWGWENPAASLPMVRRSIPPARSAPEEVLAEALAHTDLRVGMIIRMAAYMGLRCCEIARAHRRDLTHDLFGPVLLVRGKGGRHRPVPMPADIYEDFVRITDRTGGWLFPGKIDGHLSSRWVSKLGARVLPSPWTMHTLRHRFGTRAYAVDHDIVAVQLLLGHSQLTTTQRYVLPAQEALRRAVDGAA
ncbi:tyrosine-type recombinase/integrase [Actinobaculum sp. 352]|uniref:tyrosine-type recombinase/integrase n=1 Tax=Actinobaculum sp. 352 TaxID=2490946 RepID=UPI0019D252D1|nr:tyrosine-type recombinase/integrase [Actinobaculum sp. 352]